MIPNYETRWLQTPSTQQKRIPRIHAGAPGARAPLQAAEPGPMRPVAARPRPRPGRVRVQRSYAYSASICATRSYR